jgi:UMF1 family MFS transporter
MKRFTKLEWAWILYDIGNSAFILMVSTLIPIYFNYLSGEAGVSSADYLGYWGYAASAATVLVAFIGPTFGTLADTKGFKKPIFLASLLLGVGACLTLGFFTSWLAFLVVFVIAKVGYSASLVFYDSMIGDVTTPERVDEVSSMGYGWGYIGSCIPFAVCLVLVLGRDAVGLSLRTAMILSFWIVGLWWLLVTLPLLRRYQQTHSVPREPGAVRRSFARLAATARDIRKEKKVFLFLLSFFFYIDGVYTIIEMATAYGKALGLDSTGLLLALLVTQLVAFPSALLFGRLSRSVRSETLITICIVAYTGVALFALFLTTQLHFWILAVWVGMFQGGIQALSRSHFTKIIPPERSGEYFGIMDICGKGASFVGTMLVGGVSQLTGSANKGVAILAAVFLVGLVLFRLSGRAPAPERAPAAAGETPE